jgi:hypothetical protein
MNNDLKDKNHLTSFRKINFAGDGKELGSFEGQLRFLLITFLVETFNFLSEFLSWVDLRRTW